MFVDWAAIVMHCINILLLLNLNRVCRLITSTDVSSPETAYLKVDLFMATDSSSISILILLDLSSASDTVSHSIPIS